MQTAIDAFRQAIQNTGIDPPAETIADGDLHRFGVKKNCWYVLHADDLAAGAFWLLETRHIGNMVQSDISNP